MPQDVQSPVVFISYAHENDVLRASVKSLADWLDARGCQTLTDHAHIHRPPPSGWPVWMQDCIYKADIVLVVCTPKLKGRYEKNAPPDSGLGATFEGAIVTQHLYDAAMRNTKFFPILPDSGSVEDVPTFLRPWLNGHRFPSANDGIRRMIFNGSGGSMADTELGPHERITIKALDAAEHLMSALQDQFCEYYTGQPTPKNAEEFVRFIARTERTSDEVQSLFRVIRFALLELKNREEAVCKKAKEAASFLYCLAAFSLVDKEVAKTCASGTRGHMGLIRPYQGNVTRAVIATVLFGGSLRVVHDYSTDGQGFFKPEFVIDGDVLSNGDKPSIECAAYAAFFPDARDLPDILAAGNLPDERRDALKVRLGDHRFKKVAFALVLHQRNGVTDGNARQVADDLELPILLQSSDMTTELLGVDEGIFNAHVAALCDTFNEIDTPSRTPPTRTGDSPMSAGTTIVNVHGSNHTFVMATGSQSTATAQVSRDISEVLAPLLLEFRTAISTLPSSETRTDLEDQIKIVNEEAEKKANANLGVIRQAIRSIQDIGSAGSTIRGCEKIVEICASVVEAIKNF